MFCHNSDHFHGGVGRLFRMIAMAIGGVCLAAFFGLIFGELVEILWNHLMPGLFGLKLITFWQAFGLVILAKILFSGSGLHGQHHRKLHDHVHDHFHDRAWKPGGSYKNWHHYHRYWEEEGKQAFEDYLKRTGTIDSSN